MGGAICTSAPMMMMLLILRFAQFFGQPERRMRSSACDYSG
jgi:hypothetical protein